MAWSILLVALGASCAGFFAGLLYLKRIRAAEELTSRLRNKQEKGEDAGRPEPQAKDGEELRRELERAREQLKPFQDEVEYLNKKLEEAFSAETAALDKLAKLEIERGDRTAGAGEAIRTGPDVDKLQQESDRLKKGLEEAKKQLAVAKVEAQQAKKDVLAAQAKAKGGTDQTGRKQQEELIGLKSKLTEAQQAAGKLSDELAELKTKLAEVDRGGHQQQEELTGLKAKLAEETTLRLQAEEKAKAAERIPALEAEIERLKRAQVEPPVEVPAEKPKVRPSEPKSFWPEPRKSEPPQRSSAAAVEGETKKVSPFDRGGPSPFDRGGPSPFDRATPSPFDHVSASPFTQAPSAKKIEAAPPASIPPAVEKVEPSKPVPPPSVEEKREKERPAARPSDGASGVGVLDVLDGDPNLNAGQRETIRAIYIRFAPRVAKSAAGVGEGKLTVMDALESDPHLNRGQKETIRTIYRKIVPKARA